MSWSIAGSKGTKAAVLRQVAEAKMYGTPSIEETACFELARSTLKSLVEATPEDSGGQTVIVEYLASGHGPSISALRVTIEYIALS